jgi:hypothetical protein
MRMGASKRVVEWFIELNNGGLSFFDTLLYANTSALHLYKDMPKEKKYMCSAKNIKELSFEAEPLDKGKVPVACLDFTVRPGTGVDRPKE